MSWVWSPVDPAETTGCTRAGSYCCLHLTILVDGSCPACVNDARKPEPEPEQEPQPPVVNG